MHEKYTTKKVVNVASSPASKKDILADSTELLYRCLLELRPVPVCDPPPSTAAMPFKGTVRDL